FHNPPSFVPSGTHKRNSRSTARNNNASLPASFEPKRRRKPQSAQPNSIKPRSIAPSSQAYQNRLAQSSNPRSTANNTYGRSSSSMRSTDQHRGTNASRSAAQSFEQFNGNNPIPGAGVKKKKHIGRIIAAIIAILLILVAVLGFGAWQWVNNNLQKQNMGGSSTSINGETSWLLVGSDEREEGQISYTPDLDGFRTDTLLVLVKPKKGASALISIPRDSLVTVQGISMKINSVAENYGYSELVKQVNTITGLSINHVVKIKFAGLKNIVDALDGVELCYDQTVNDPESNLNWTAGCHVANGDTALAFSRMRYSDANGDFGRAARQRQVISAIMKKSLTPSTLTNISMVQKLAKTGLENLVVDNNTDTGVLIQMALAFRDATGKSGITGSVYWTDQNYYVDGVGSSVLLDSDKNLALFSAIVEGTQTKSPVGTLAESAAASQ
ncbi:MAG: LCP family protein, partial [Bifidobacteriaceae bacterium]|nr:LCP family protein [Bifidobacteriaceae bacterium]